MATENILVEEASNTLETAPGLLRDSASRSELHMFPRILGMRFRFQRFALRICSEGIDDSIKTNLASSMTLIEIGNPA
jgi:hypothetical protein